jgi:protease-4
MSNETKKVALVVGLIVVSILIGSYNRAQSLISHQATSVMPKAAVMVIPIEGMITSMGTQWEGSMVDIFMDQLVEAKESKSVKAVVLRINSPGGTVGASQEIAAAIQRFKTETKKPVIVSIMDIGASGAYWIALASDYIFAHPGSIVGSLGVITQTFDFTQVPQKYGVDVRTYKAGVHKDLLNPWRKPTKDDNYLVNKMLTTVHKQFQTMLIESRNIAPDRAAILTDGRIYAGEDALRESLVDALGGLHTAVQYAGKKVGLDDPKVVYPNRGFKNWVQSFRAMVESFSVIHPSAFGPVGMH